jgi:hypothetical protein
MFSNRPSMQSRCIAVGPQMSAGRPFDQLGVDPHPVPGFANAALDHQNCGQPALDLLLAHAYLLRPTGTYYSPANQAPALHGIPRHVAEAAGVMR